MIEHSADISVEPPCVTYENIQGQKLHKTQTEKSWFSSEFMVYISLSHAFL